MSFFISSGVSTLPTDFTSLSIASAGVIITPKLIILLISVIFSISASIPSSEIASFAFSVN